MVLSFLTSGFFQRGLRFFDLCLSAFATFEFVGNFIAREVAKLVVISRVRTISLSQQ